jgi:hypothetical protein
MQREDLISGYIRFTDELRRGVPPNTPEMDALDHAHTALTNMVRSGPIDEAWGLVREVLRRAPDEELAQYSVALLEFFVSCRREVAVPLIEREAAADERFKWALGRVYLDADLPNDSLRRLQSASDNAISLPGRRDL